MSQVAYELSVEDEADKIAFSSAYLAHSPIHATKYFGIEGCIEDDDVEKVIRGLAKVSLMPPGSNYHGLSQAEADYRLGDISGDVRDFFCSILPTN